jgi:hypothetical protein
MSQAEWNAARAKLQSGPDYVMVRRSAQAGQFAGDKKGGRDGVAINWFEINKLDLPAATGGKEYDDTKIKKDLADLEGEVDDLQKQVDAIDTSDLATKKQLNDAVKVLQDQIDAIKNSGGGGDSFDPTELIADIDALAKDLNDLEDAVDVDTAAIAKNTEDVKNNSTAIANNASQARVAIKQNIDDIAANAAAITDLENNKVELAAGQSMLTIWRGSTAEYDDLTTDPDTLYIVTP